GGSAFLISVDTNIVVRLLTKDDPAQFELSKAAFEENQVFIPITVILETEWVLRYTYGFSRETIGEALTRLMNLPNVTSSDDAALKLALSWHRQGLDFSDALHLACSRST